MRGRGRGEGQKSEEFWILYTLTPGVNNYEHLLKKKQPAGVLLSISRFPKIYIAALVNVQYTAILVTPLPPPELQSLNLCPVGNEFDNLRTIQH